MVYVWGKMSENNEEILLNFQVRYDWVPPTNAHGNAPCWRQNGCCSYSLTNHPIDEIQKVMFNNNDRHFYVMYASMKIKIVGDNAAAVWKSTMRLCRPLICSFTGHYKHRRSWRGYYALGGMQLGSVCKYFCLNCAFFQNRRSETQVILKFFVVLRRKIQLFVFCVFF